VLLDIFKKEKAFNMPPDEQPCIITVGRFKQILEINRPSRILPDVAPRILCKICKMPNNDLFF
jgi:hypothetical protein